MIYLTLTLFFGYLSLVSLGGGMAVLPEMERLCVTHGWLSAEEFARCYNMGQLAPGPNCMMVVLIGQKAAGLPGAAVVLLAFLLPSATLALLVGRAYHRIRGTYLQQKLRSSLAPITVGMIAAGFDLLARANLTGPASLLICLVVLALLLRTKVNPALLILGAAMLGPWL